MVKKSKKQINLNAATSHKAKNFGATSEAKASGSDHCEPDHAVLMKVSNKKSMVVRRSGRLHSVVESHQTQEGECINIVLLESDKEEGEPHGDLIVEQTSTLSETHHRDANKKLKSNQKNLDEKVHDLLKAFEGFKTKGSRKKVDFNYKSLYLDSQKKEEALTLENHKLSRMLEITLGKLEVYDNFNKSAPTYMNIISKLEKVIETLASPLLRVGQFSSLSSDAETGGGVMAKETHAKAKNVVMTSK